MDENQIPEEYRPLSFGSCLGHLVLFSIPCVGLVMMLVYAFGGGKNVNLRNLSRAYLCLMVIGLVLGVCIYAVSGVGAYAALYN